MFPGNYRKQPSPILAVVRVCQRRPRGNIADFFPITLCSFLVAFAVSALSKRNHVTNGLPQAWARARGLASHLEML